MDIIEELEYQQLVLECMEAGNPVLIVEEDIKMRDVLSMAKKYSGQQMGKMGEAMKAFAKAAPEKYKPIGDKIEGIVNKIPFIGRISPEWRKKIVMTLFMIAGGSLVGDFISDFISGGEEAAVEGLSDSGNTAGDAGDSGNTAGDAGDVDVGSGSGPISDIDKFMTDDGQIAIYKGGIMKELIESDGSFSDTFKISKDDVTGVSSSYSGVDDYGSDFSGSSSFSGDPQSLLNDLDKLKESLKNPSSAMEYANDQEMFRMKVKVLNDMLAQDVVEIDPSSGVEIDPDYGADEYSQELQAFGNTVDPTGIANSNAEMGIDVSNIRQDLSGAINKAIASDDPKPFIRAFVEKYPNTEPGQLQGVIDRILAGKQTLANLRSQGIID